MVKGMELESPPRQKRFPKPGLLTLICAVPVFAISDAGMIAVSWVPLTTVVARRDPFHSKTDDEPKLLPSTVRVNCGPPGVAVFGDNEEIPGGRHSSLPQDASANAGTATSKTDAFLSIDLTASGKRIAFICFSPLAGDAAEP
jgi:hypothetical protein